MDRRRLSRILLAVLCGLFLGLYLIAKLDFFTSYDQPEVVRYLKKHSTYWAAMAAVALAIWILERWFPQDRK